VKKGGQGGKKKRITKQGPGFCQLPKLPKTTGRLAGREGLWYLLVGRRGDIKKKRLIGTRKRERQKGKESQGEVCQLPRSPKKSSGEPWGK